MPGPTAAGSSAGPEVAELPQHGWQKALVLPLGLTIALAAAYTAGYGVWDEVIVRGGFVGAACLIVILTHPLAVLHRRAPSPVRMLLWAIDALLFIGMAVTTWWLFSVNELLQTGLYDFTLTDNVFAAIGIVTLIELSRRLFGWIFAAVAVAVLFYALYGQDLPGMLRHRGASIPELLRVSWYSFDGVFGRPIAVVTSIILIFILFGAVLDGLGAGEVLLRISSRLTDNSRGGPANAAVVSSAAFGTMSGSVVANVVSTGVFTIPMIIKRGFSRAFGGAVEAAASTGGQIMPPVMGAVAFIMADVTGIPYLTIALAALVPALFYYFAIFAAISVEAARRGIGPVPRAMRQSVSASDWIRSAYLIVPLTIIVVTLVMGRSPALAGFYAFLSALALGLVFNADVRRRPYRLLPILARGGSACGKILVAVATVGIIIGVFNLTGLGQDFARAVSRVSEGNLFLSLLLMAGGSLILGMGLPTVPAYLIIVIVMGPAVQVIDDTVSTLALHLFVVYFGVLSSITPPVALGAFAAAPLCGANPLAVAVSAIRVAFIGFLIPFVMIYNPSLLLVVDFDPVEFAWVVLRLGLAVWLLTTGFGGYAGGRIAWIERVLRVGCAVAMLMPGLWIEAGAVAVGLALVAWRRWLLRRGGEGAAASQT
jgi:TRAP transporter 4TM/12TM fusion protein